MLRFLRNLKIWQKLGLLVAFMGIALGVVAYGYLQAKNADIEKNNIELASLEYLKSARQLVEHLPRRRGTLSIILNGDQSESLKQTVRELDALVDEDFKGMEAADAKFGATLKTTEPIKTFKQRWQTLKTASLQMQPRESFEQHTALIRDFLGFLADLADTAELNIDPHLDSFHMGQALTKSLPKAAEILGALRGRSSGVAAAKQLSEDNKLDLISDRAIFQDSIDSINRDIRVAVQYSPGEWDAQLMPPLKNLNTLTSSYLKTLDTRIIKAQTIDIPPQELFGEGTKTLEAYFQLYDATITSINTDMMHHYVEWRRDRQIAIAVIILGFGLALLLAGFITRSITNQVNEMTSLFGQIGIGNFEARATILSEDELGQTSTNLNAMLDNVLTLIQSQEEREQIQHSIMKLLDEISGVAEGDLTQEAEVTAEMTGAIADSFNFMIGELRRIISNVQEVTVNVSAAATEVQSTTEHLAEGSEAQAVQIVDTSAAIEEMAASIQQVSENAVLSATVSEQARVNAKQGSEAVQKTIYGMNGIRQQVQETAKRIKRLGESSQEIGEIVQLISDIADRTSILALNASIQAAMAGEAGRGFAVVAGEVERLAERSAEATKRISTLIKTIQSETNEAVAAMETTTREVVVGSEVANEAGKSLVEIETVSNRLAELMQSISMATKQQARGSESVAKAMGDISDITQQTAAGTKQAAVSIRKLSELADNLRVSVSTFKLPSNGHGSAY